MPRQSNSIQLDCLVFLQILSSQLTYSIVTNEDNSNGSFKVNSTTGEITLKKRVDLENMTAELNGQYTFTVSTPSRGWGRKRV